MKSFIDSHNLSTVRRITNPDLETKETYDRQPLPIHEKQSHTDTIDRMMMQFRPSFHESDSGIGGSVVSKESHTSDSRV